ncbi:MAG: hypothetical protein LBS30_04040 [Planctomycetota bacterium]|jgi:hypothetical protein|nr:hypothetical protein [Planctomycetota bacterium]
MQGKTLLAVLTLLFFLFLAAAPEARAGMTFQGGLNDEEEDAGTDTPLIGSAGKFFPDTGDIDDLVKAGKTLTYKSRKFQELYGAAGNRYLQFGMLNMMSSDYTYGGDDRRVSLEIATMESPTAAAGLFHHHRGTVLRSQGEAIDVGAEGVLDTPRGRRNLYFYRGRYFVKIVYSGKDPAPSLITMAEFVDAGLPSGRDAKPAGFEYIDIEGVNKDTISLTPGLTFNASFLPASVWASAPGGGSPASDLFLITRYSYKEAAELYKDYHTYLNLHAEYIEEYRRGDLKLTKSLDPSQGRVLFAAYKNVLIIVARPDGYEKGEVLIDRVIEKIDSGAGAESGGKPERSEGKRKRRIWPFGRRGD